MSGIRPADLAGTSLAPLADSIADELQLPVDAAVTAEEVACYRATVASGCNCAAAIAAVQALKVAHFLGNEAIEEQAASTIALLFTATQLQARSGSSASAHKATPDDMPALQAALAMLPPLAQFRVLDQGTKCQLLVDKEVRAMHAVHRRDAKITQANTNKVFLPVSVLNGNPGAEDRAHRIIAGSAATPPAGTATAPVKHALLRRLESAGVPCVKLYRQAATACFTGKLTAVGVLTINPFASTVKAALQFPSLINCCSTLLSLDLHGIKSAPRLRLALPHLRKLHVVLRFSVTGGRSFQPRCISRGTPAVEDLRLSIDYPAGRNDHDAVTTYIDTIAAAFCLRDWPKLKRLRVPKVQRWLGDLELPAVQGAVVHAIFVRGKQSSRSYEAMGQGLRALRPYGDAAASGIQPVKVFFKPLPRASVLAKLQQACAGACELLQYKGTNEWSACDPCRRDRLQDQAVAARSKTQRKRKLSSRSTQQKRKLRKHSEQAGSNE